MPVFYNHGSPIHGHCNSSATIHTQVPASKYFTWWQVEHITVLVSNWGNAVSLETVFGQVLLRAPFPYHQATVVLPHESLLPLVLTAAVSYLWVGFSDYTTSLSPSIMAGKHYKFQILTLDLWGICGHTAPLSI